MREYLLVWRALPKLLVGGIFLTEIMLLLLGRRGLVVFADECLRLLSAYFSGATLLLVIVILIGIAANLGLFALLIASAAARTLASLLLRLLPRRLSLANLPLRELFENPYVIALRRFGERSAFYVQFYELKSSSFSLEAVEKAGEFDKHFNKVRSHISDSLPEDVEAINFYSMLGQDRRTYEILADEVQALENLVIVLLLASMTLSVLGVNGIELFWFIILVVALGLSILPEIARRRCFLANFLLTAYLDTFTVYKGADVADREGEAYI